jgi:nucleotide-binding universal stress UspA family protein
VRPPAVIAVGFDGSPDAEHALLWAAALAAAMGARLEVVHAVGVLEHAGLAARVAGHEATVARVAREAGLDAAQVHWRAADGEPCSVLRRAAAHADGAELLVVGSRGMGAHTGGLLGSTSLELAQSSSVPLVIVHPS